MKRSLLFIVATLYALVARSAPGWESNPIGSLSAIQSTERFEKTFPGFEAVQFKSGIDLHRLRYRSNNGQRTVGVSGLLAVPHSGAPRGLVIFFRGFTTDRRGAPSQFDGSSLEVQATFLAFTQAGYAVAMPDTFGFGDDRQRHPTFLGAVNCQTGIDIVPPSRALAAKIGIQVGPKLFVSGYSEGGAVALWMVRKLEAKNNSGLTLAMAAPMAGPYDLSGTMAKWMLGQTPDPVLRGFKLVASAYLALGIQARTPGLRLEDYFAPSFASYIPLIADQEMTPEALGKKLMGKATQLGALRSTETVLTRRMRDVLRNRDERDPVMRAMIANDCYDWQPRTKMLLAYVPGDRVVPDTSSTLGAGIMAKSGNVRALSIGERLDHGGGFLPGLLMAIRFFDGGFAAAQPPQLFLRGTVTYRQKVALPPTATIKIRLEDITKPERNPVLVAETLFEAKNRQVPIPFEVPYRMTQIFRGHQYALRATISFGGKIVYKNLESVRVEFGGETNPFEIVVDPVNATPIFSFSYSRELGL